MDERQHHRLSFTEEVRGLKTEEIDKLIKENYLQWGEWGVDKSGKQIFGIAKTNAPMLDAAINQEGEIGITVAAIESAIELASENLDYSTLSNARRRLVAAHMGVCIEEMRRRTGDPVYLPPFFTQSPKAFLESQKEKLP